MAAPIAPALAETPSVMRTTGWDDYELIDSGAGRKLERYGRWRVVRPEPQCLWTPRLPQAEWDAADAVFDPEGEEDTGRWRFPRPLDPQFPLAWRDVRFHGRFTPFRHLGFFPEQAANWAYVDAEVRAAGRPIKLLNLFGYTGVASLVDARRFVQREVRRGSRYDGIILDPPKYGRGPNGEVWRLYEDLPEMITNCAALLAEDARFLIANVYAERISGLAVGSLLRQALAGRGGRIDWGELALVEQGGERAVGLSFFARWSAEG